MKIMPMILHVNQHVIKANIKKPGNEDPPITIRKGKNGKSSRAMEVDLVDEAGKLVGRLTYRPHQPLSCGARLWLEVYGLKVIPKKSSHPSDCQTASHCCHNHQEP